MSRGRTGTAFVQVTSVEDGATHLVAFRLYEAGLMAGRGRYAAVCGRSVPAAAMVVAPARRCPPRRGPRSARRGREARGGAATQAATAGWQVGHQNRLRARCAVCAIGVPQIRHGCPVRR